MNNQLNLPQKGAVVAALCLVHCGNMNTLPTNRCIDSISLARVDLDLAQPKPRFQFPTVDSIQVNMVRSAPAHAIDSKLKAEFELLAKRWENETSFQSSLGDVFTNEAYQRMMAMGRAALPMILSELQRKPGHWFYALEKIAGKDEAAGAKNFAEARAVWLEWGRKNRYI